MWHWDDSFVRKLAAKELKYFYYNVSYEQINIAHTKRQKNENRDLRDVICLSDRAMS